MATKYESEVTEKKLTEACSGIIIFLFIDILLIIGDTPNWVDKTFVQILGSCFDITVSLMTVVVVIYGAIMGFGLLLKYLD